VFGFAFGQVGAFDNQTEFASVVSHCGIGMAGRAEAVPVRKKRELEAF